MKRARTILVRRAGIAAIVAVVTTAAPADAATSPDYGRVYATARVALKTRAIRCSHHDLPVEGGDVAHGESWCRANASRAPAIRCEWWVRDGDTVVGCPKG